MSEDRAMGKVVAVLSVMPRSRFTAELPRILQTHCTPA